MPTNSYPDFTLDQLGPFLTANPGRGTMRVKVSTADNSFPIPNAIVEVSAVISGTVLPLYRRKTNSSGIVDRMILPAKPRLDSQRESTAGNSSTLYTVTVSHPSFHPLTDKRVVIYDGVETIFPAALQPIVV